MLNAQNITVRYGKHDILHNIDFHAQPGAVTAIVGPNGSGKTTLLKAITGEVAHGGTVTLNDMDIDAAKAWELAAIRAVLPQATPLAFPFTVSEVVQLGLSNGISAARVRLIVAALERVGLSGYGARYYQELSGGEQQRVGIARAVVNKPPLLLADEPTGNLDPALSEEIMDLFKDFARVGVAVLIATHDLSLIARYNHRLLTLREGRLIHDGDESGEAHGA